MDFDEDLIREVKVNEILYNLQTEDYKNIAKKDQVWNEIGERLNTTGETCKKRWKNLRDTYKKIKQRSGSDQRRNWKYYNSLRFLDNVKCFRRQTKEFIQPEVEYNFDVGGTTVTGGFAFPATSNEALMETYMSNSKGHKRRRTDIDAKFEQFLGMASETIKQSCAAIAERQHAEKDSTSLLFEALSMNIKNANLTRDQVAEIESSVSALVYEKISSFKYGGYK